MASIKIVLRKNKAKKDGTIPLAIRITKNRKTRYVFTGFYIEEKHWNTDIAQVRKSHPNSARLNNMLIKLLAKANDQVIEAESGEEVLTPLDIKKKIKNAAGGSFYQVAEARIQQKRKEGLYSVANPENSILNHIKAFHKNNDLAFSEITSSFISHYKTYCKSKDKSPRTITNHLIFIRTIYNIAIKDGLAKSEHYPFGGDNEKIRIKRSMKIGLNAAEIEKIEGIALDEGSGAWHARNVFLFSFYFAGVRIADVLKLQWDDIKDGRLYYVMDKNDKPDSLKVSEKAQAILSLYKDPKAKKNDFIFPDLKGANLKDAEDVYRKINTATKRFNKHLKNIAKQIGIDKNLSNHISRHSFGNISGDKIHPIMLQKLYRHSDLKTTINYQANFIHADADDALESVIGS